MPAGRPSLPPSSRAASSSSPLTVETGVQTDWHLPEFGDFVVRTRHPRAPARDPPVAPLGPSAAAGSPGAATTGGGDASAVSSSTTTSTRPGSASATAVVGATAAAHTQAQGPVGQPEPEPLGLSPLRTRPVSIRVTLVPEGYRGQQATPQVILLARASTSRPTVVA